MGKAVTEETEDPRIVTTDHLRAAMARVSLERSCLDMGWAWEAQEVSRRPFDPHRSVQHLISTAEEGR